VTVYWEVSGDSLVYDVYSDRDEEGNEALAITVVRGFANLPLFVSLCPMDQDGITKIPSIQYDSKTQIVSPKDLPQISLSEPPIRVVTMPIVDGHAGKQVNTATSNSTKAQCDASVASWAAAFPVRSNPNLIITLDGNPPEDFPDLDVIEEKWEEVVEQFPEIDTSSEEANYFFTASAIVLRLLADIKKSIITVGPSLQEQIWLPALVYQTKALDRLGFSEEVVLPILDNIHSMVDTNGLAVKNKQFDSQGTLCLAIAHHYYYTNNLQWLGEKFSALKRMCEWVIRVRKRQEAEIPENHLITGLLPTGHASWFDPLYWKTDYYYSHNFWAAGVLEITSNLAKALGRHGEVERFEAELEKYKQNLDDSITQLMNIFDYLPSGPFQRDNAEMIFNLHAFYPLKLYLPGFKPIANTLDWLWNNYAHDGGILIDQPWNAFGTYLSLLIAQAYRYIEEPAKVKQIIDFMLKNATNRAGWAEGISPLSKKGAVGDSPNGYTAAEWVNLILDLFVEEHLDTPPVILKGMPMEWLQEGVSAKGLKLQNNATMDLIAKIDENKLQVTWKYEGGVKGVIPYLSLPTPLSELPQDVSQVSTLCIILPSIKGDLELKLDLG
ncbi:MAG: hypothetical protein ACXADH_11100, partial [Candidatus Kariarchaeaceae archaeon]